MYNRGPRSSWLIVNKLFETLCTSLGLNNGLSFNLSCRHRFIVWRQPPEERGVWSTRPEENLKWMRCSNCDTSDGVGLGYVLTVSYSHRSPVMCDRNVASVCDRRWTSSVTLLQRKDYFLSAVTDSSAAFRNERTSNLLIKDRTIILKAVTDSDNSVVYNYTMTTTVKMFKLLYLRQNQAMQLIGESLRSHKQLQKSCN